MLLSTVISCCATPAILIWEWVLVGQLEAETRLNLGIPGLSLNPT